MAACRGITSPPLSNSFSQTREPFAYFCSVDMRFSSCTQITLIGVFHHLQKLDRVNNPDDFLVSDASDGQTIFVHRALKPLFGSVARLNTVPAMQIHGHYSSSAISSRKASMRELSCSIRSSSTSSASSLLILLGSVERSITSSSAWAAAFMGVFLSVSPGQNPLKKWSWPQNGQLPLCAIVASYN